MTLQAKIQFLIDQAYNFPMNKVIDINQIGIQIRPSRKGLIRIQPKPALDEDLTR